MITFAEMKDSYVEDLAKALVCAYAAPPWNETWSLEQAQKSIAHICTGTDARGYVAINDGKPVAALLGKIQLYRDYEFYVNQVFVDPAFQHQNIGRKLMDFTEKQLKKQGIIQLSLSTINEDEEFYRKCGYQIADWLEMKKAL